MLCEKILGTLDTDQVSGKKIEYVDIEWDDAMKRIHRKTTDAGTDIGIRLDDSILTRGLQENDILYEDDSRVIVVRILPCEIIRVKIDPDHRFMIAKVCYEIGNRHAPLFYGKEDDTFITPYNEPMLLMLSKLHGVSCERAVEKLDFERRISSGAGHTHDHGHHHHH